MAAVAVKAHWQVFEDGALAHGMQENECKFYICVKFIDNKLKIHAHLSYTLNSILAAEASNQTS